jgi:hypothetical protein
VDFPAVLESIADLPFLGHRKVFGLF